MRLQTIFIFYKPQTTIKNFNPQSQIEHQLHSFWICITHVLNFWQLQWQKKNERLYPEFFWRVSIPTEGFWWLKLCSSAGKNC